MIISKLKRTVMKGIDFSNKIRYSAVVDNKTLFMYETDDVFHPHITKEEFKSLILDNETA